MTALVYVVRDGALQPVAVFSSEAKAWSYIDASATRRGWDVECFVVDASMIRRATGRA